MLGSENTLHFSFIVKELIKANLPKTLEKELLNRFKKYQGHNDDFDRVEQTVRKEFSL